MGCNCSGKKIKKDENPSEVESTSSVEIIKNFTYFLVMLTLVTILMPAIFVLIIITVYKSCMGDGLEISGIVRYLQKNGGSEDDNNEKYDSDELELVGVDEIK